MIEQRRSMHHVSDRHIVLMPMQHDESDASRIVGRICIALSFFAVLWFALQFIR